MRSDCRDFTHSSHPRPRPPPPSTPPASAETASAEHLEQAGLWLEQAVTGLHAHGNLEYLSRGRLARATLHHATDDCLQFNMSVHAVGIIVLDETGPDDPLFQYLDVPPSRITDDINVIDPGDARHFQTHRLLSRSSVSASALITNQTRGFCYDYRDYIARTPYDNSY